MKKKSTVTASELMKELSSNKEYMDTIQKRKEEKEEFRRQMAIDQRDLLLQCKEVGISINSVWDLVNTSCSYKNAIPILASHLSKEHHPKTIEGIVRSLMTPESRGMAFDALVDLFVNLNDSSSEIKWLTGSAIVESAQKENTDTLFKLIKDESHGYGRFYLPLGLIHNPSDEVVSLLTSLISHPDMGKNAEKALKIITRNKKRAK